MREREEAVKEAPQKKLRGRRESGQGQPLGANEGVPRWLTAVNCEKAT